MLKDSFCSSPWFHIRLRYDGSYKVCRWSREEDTKYNIKDTSILEFYNSEPMREIRSELLAGNRPKGCSACYYQDQFGKINGRKRQLLKSVISTDDFDLSMRASPHYKHFKHSWDNQGHADHAPVDLQIDLGNICNSGCVMCGPYSSSRLERDYVSLNQYEPGLFEAPRSYRSWTRDPELVNRFVDQLAEIPNLGYIHFLGGETLYDPAFYAICDRLLETGIAKDAIIGTTTNATIYDERIERYIREFKEFHLGISIEAVTDLNDYIRWPSKINSVLETIDRFCALREGTGLFISLRITPNLFTAYELDKMIQFMLDRQIIAESCNILTTPSVLRMEIMPDNIRLETIDRIRSVIDQHHMTASDNINVRNSARITETIHTVALEYLSFLENYSVPEDRDQQADQLVRFLKAFERLRNNRIIDHAPRFADFLRHHGYRDC